MSIKMMMVLGLAPSDAAAAPQIPGMIPLCEESSI